MAESEAKVNMSLDDIIKMEKKKKGPQRGGGVGGGGSNYRGGNTRGRGGYNNRGNMRGRGGYNNRGHNPNYNNRNYGNNNYNNYNNHNNYNNNNNNHHSNNNGHMNYYNNRNNMNNNRRGVGGAPYRRYQQNGVRGGYVQKRYNNGNNNHNNNNNNNAPMSANLRRSRSSVSLSRMSFAQGSFNNGVAPRNSYSPRRSNRGGAGTSGGGGGGGGGAYRMSRSRSRSNLRYQDNNAYEDEVYESPSQSFLQRTNSLPDLRDEDSVYNRLGYQSNAQAAYRNRVKRTTSRISNNSSNNFMSQILQRQNKNLKMQNALQVNLSPSGKGMPLMRQRRYSVGNVRADQQLLRAQKRAQYEQKIMRMNASRSNIPPLDYMSSLNEYASKQHPALALYQSQNSLNPRQLRSKSPYAQSLKGFQTIIPKTEPKSPRRPPQRRARSRSRSRARSTRNSAISLEGDLEDRSFSEVMYSLSNNFGVTGRTLNDRFSLI